MREQPQASEETNAANFLLLALNELRLNIVARRWGDLAEQLRDAIVLVLHMQQQLGQIHNDDKLVLYKTVRELRAESSAPRSNDPPLIDLRHASITASEPPRPTQIFMPNNVVVLDAFVNNLRVSFPHDVQYCDPLGAPYREYNRRSGIEIEVSFVGRFAIEKDRPDNLEKERANNG
jgi:hypothetical protein